MSEEVWLGCRQIERYLREEDSRVHALRGVSLDLEPGSVHAVVGPSGCGKSTLLYTLNRLREPDSGDIYLDGENIAQLEVFDLRRRVGLVMQKAIFFPGSVGDNILYGPGLWHKVSVRRSLAKSPVIQEPELAVSTDPRHFLDLVGLDPDWVDRDPATLSGGQQQRVALARTLANNPEVLLLDEPTSALDAQAVEILENLVRRLVREQGLTVIWVTHDLHQARRVATEITLLFRGRLIEQGPAQAFFTEPRTEEGRAYLAGRLGDGK